MKITRRSRIGLSWTNTPGRDGGVIDPPLQPEITGYISTVWAEYQRIAQNNNANHWRHQFFVRENSEWIPVTLGTFEIRWLLAKETDCIEAVYNTLPRE